jgi:hypothetical protein
MLVDLIVLRLEGRKRPVDELRSSTPRRVELQVANGVATIGAPGEPPSQRAQLREVRLVKVTTDAFVLTGQQDYALPDRQTMARVQSWWCRPVPPLGG